MANTDGKPSRHTMQKEAVRRALEEAEGFVSAPQLHRILVEQGESVGLATVYRQLGALARAGQVDTVPVAGSQLFRACQPGVHHHHLVCEECGKAAEISPPDESWINAEAKQHGFTITRHVFELFGRCADCESAR